MYKAAMALRMVEHIQQVKDHLRARIFRGELAEGTRIDAGEVREETRVSVRAVKQALRDLAREGLLRRTRHVGTFVSGDLPAAVCAVLPRVHSVAILTSLTQAHLSSAFFATLMLQGIRESLKPPSLLTTLTNTRIATIDDVPAVDLNTVKRSAQGLIALEANHAPILNELVRGGLPVVAVDFCRQGHLFDALQLDHMQSGYLATTHLMNLGHRRIAWVGEGANRQSSDPTWQDRLAGYLCAMAEGTGREPQPLIFDAARSERVLLREWPAFHARYKPTAYLAASFGFAKALNAELERAGLRCPEDVSIACAEGGWHLSRFERLSSVRVDYEQAGRAAVRLLASRLACSAMPPIRQVMPVEFVARGTSRPPSGEPVSIQP